jgi:hypothetical protein
MRWDATSAPKVRRVTPEETPDTRGAMEIRVQRGFIERVGPEGIASRHRAHIIVFLRDWVEPTCLSKSS